MENRNKFYGSGLWAKHNLVTRFKDIYWALEAYCDNKNKRLDNLELDFIIKNAFVSKFYVSEGVYKACSNYPSLKQTSAKEIYTKLIRESVLDLTDKGATINNNISLNPEYFRIDYCVKKINEKVSDKKHNPDKVIVFEHVIPGKVYLDYAIELFRNNAFTLDSFKKIFDKVCVCLITKKEEIDSLSKLVSIMPPDKKHPGNYVDFISHPFARYDVDLNGSGIGINIHGPWIIEDGRLKSNDMIQI